MTKCAYDSCRHNAIYTLSWYRRNARGEIESGIDCKVCSCEEHIKELAVEHRNYGLVDKLQEVGQKTQTKDCLNYLVEELNTAIRKKNFIEDMKKYDPRNLFRNKK